MKRIWGGLYLKSQDDRLRQALSKLAGGFFLKPIVEAGTLASSLSDDVAELVLDPDGRYVALAWISLPSQRLLLSGWSDPNEGFPRLLHVSSLVEQLACDAAFISYHMEESLLRYYVYRSGEPIEWYNSQIQVNQPVDLEHWVFEDPRDPLTIYAKSRIKRYPFFSRLKPGDQPRRSLVSEEVKALFVNDCQGFSSFFGLSSSPVQSMMYSGKDPVEIWDFLTRECRIPALGTHSLIDLITHRSIPSAKGAIWRHPKAVWLRPSELTWE